MEDELIRALIDASQVAGRAQKDRGFSPEYADALQAPLDKLLEEVLPLTIGPSGRPCGRCGGSGREPS